MQNLHNDIDVLGDCIKGGAIKRGEITENEVIDRLILDVKRWNDDTYPISEPDFIYTASVPDADEEQAPKNGAHIGLILTPYLVFFLSTVYFLVSHYWTEILRLFA
ncbi:MAG: hypothetical protein LBM41_01350 [Ruminococcus sp.]|jgi:hypothetical protein|nr:hypothetical protein [Ruminococcus sp.]